MKLTITIECDNAAFEGDWTEEVTRILTKLSKELHPDMDGKVLKDINGNTIGRVSVED